MDSFYYIKVDISEIKGGDTILHNGILTTVCSSNIKKSSFMGISIFGDTYISGRKKVIKCILKKRIKD